MTPEVIEGWLFDLHSYSHRCDDPARCSLGASAGCASPPSIHHHGSYITLQTSQEKRPVPDDATISPRPPTKRRRQTFESDMDEQDAPGHGGHGGHGGPRKDVAADEGGGDDLGNKIGDYPSGSRGRSSSPKKRRRCDSRSQGLEKKRDRDDELPTTLDTPTTSSQKGVSSQYSLRLKETTSLPPSSVTASSQPRSTSPVKLAGDLLKLKKPVRWVNVGADELADRIAQTKNEAVTALWRKIKRFALSGKGYLPQQLRDPLQNKLGLEDDDADKFSERDPVLLHPKDLEEAKSRLRRLFGRAAPDTELDRIAQVLEPLEWELDRLKTIVATTNAFKTTPRPEASWNAEVHEPLLNLVVQHQPGVLSENVTRANIAKTFIPQATAEIPLSLGSKMIDFAVVLGYDDRQPLLLGGHDNEDHGADDVHPTDDDNDDLAQRIREFVAGLDPPTFNQTTFAPLRHSPAGIFIETKADSSNGWAEGKAQLGFWLAAWFKRVAMFPRRQDSLAPTSGLPFLPVLLVVGEKWELHVAFDEGRHFAIYGGLDAGGTGDLHAAYKLLAVLRTLVKDWVTTEFRASVKALVSCCNSQSY